jgi:deoxyribodipyrimidine photo-lyase
LSTTIHWFRRDLRITDNTALNAAVARGDTLTVHVRSTWKGRHRWTGPNRQGFLCESLRSLDANLRAIGGGLVVVCGDPVDELLRLAGEVGATAVFFNRDPDPHGRAVEERLAARCAEAGIECRVFKDVAIHERDEVLTGAGEGFRVFTPYSRAWAKLPKPAVGGRPKAMAAFPGVASLPLPDNSDWGLGAAAEGIPAGGEKAARERMRDFLDHRLATYGDLRDLPASGGTSRLSQDLRFGLISIRELHRECLSRAEALDHAGRGNAMKFVTELVWREFYMQLLWAHPGVLDHEFNPKYRGMRWPGDPSLFDVWAAGMTGFPIVDAAMRELAATGFMHNRTRMITAMFLTKDLHLDWRRGEQWFMQQLVDGEIASNNGGWQWSAGTGADAAPYFRIQNPWSQSRRHDPDGAYIKKWVPELRGVPAAALHEPPAGGGAVAPGYPAPVVDHTAARAATLDLFKAHLAGR